MHMIRCFFMSLLFLGILSCSPKEKNVSQLKIISSDDNTVISEFLVEIADTKETSYRGLMGRNSMENNRGMLFDVNIIPKDMDIAMWMKDTLIPLDMIFINDNGEVFYIYENAQPNDLTPIYPPKRPRAVLEINAGQVAQYKIKIGDLVQNDIFKR